MNNESNPDNVFKPKKTPLMIGAVLLVLIVAIIVLSVFLLTRSGSGENTTPTIPTTSSPVLSNPKTTPDTTGKTEGTTGLPDVTTAQPPITSSITSDNQTSPQPPSPTTPSITTSERQYNKATPTTFSQTVDSESVGRGSMILVDENVRFNFPEDKLITRTAMANLSASVLKTEYNFTRVASSPYFIRKSNTLFLNAEANTEFVNMMNAFAAATGNTDVQLRNAYYYDKSEQVCYNATGLFVDLEINKDGGLYPLNYETLRPDYYDWFIANSYRFGFIHMWEVQSSTGHDTYSTFRYVGIPHATYMHNYNLEMDDYLNTLKSYTIEKVLTYTDDEGVAWQIYYVPADRSGKTQISLTATPGSYTISGNNMDGYIVTINTAYFS